jgi:NitT/TauT family transport system permease protein
MDATGRRQLAIALVLAGGAALVLLVVASARVPPSVGPGGRVIFSVYQIPYLAFRTMLRMVIAFALSLVFSFAYGWAAAASKPASRVLLPVLDVLQSVPILAFFPAAILFFVELFNGSSIGLEAASIFLVFTSQNWNMTFGVYEALLAIPRDTIDAAGVSGLRGWIRVRRLLIPAVVPKLVYNGVLSWAGGWYFVTASEIISANGQSVVLPGLGAFLSQTAFLGNYGALLWGLVVLATLVVAVELLVWRPLYLYADRFRFDTVAPTERRTSRATTFYRFLFPHRAISPALHRRRDAAVPRPPPMSETWQRRLRSERNIRVARRLIALAGLVLMGVIAAIVLGALVNALRMPLTTDEESVPLALIASTIRLAIAYVITLVWTVPVAIWVARNERAARWVLPTTEILASIPAVALFPVIVVLLVNATGGLEIPSIILVLTGMQWYVLFNIISGARLIPADLIAAAELSGLRGWLLWRRLYLPAMAPSLITGSITAWGGGWNALIVSEYVATSSRTYSAFGIGNLIDKAVFGATGSATNANLFVISLVSMVAYIYALNLLIWKPLYRRVLTKYKMEA